MVATLDQVSRGRVVLGIGTGWQPNEHAAYGIALPAARDRIDALDRACAVIRALLGQRQLSLLVGGGQRTQGRTARAHPIATQCQSLICTSRGAGAPSPVSTRDFRLIRYEPHLVLQ